MNSEQFATIFNQQMKLCEDTLLHKAGEYATDDDRLHNFQIASALQGCTPVQALGGMMAKHSTSIYDMIQVKDPAQFTMEMWNEKITDHINYLILLKATVHEAIWDNNSSQGTLPFAPSTHRIDIERTELPG